MSIKLIVLDVEGTLTKGNIVFDNMGNELKSFNVKDGLAISTWTKKLGRKVAIVTGRFSKSVECRAEELGVQYVYQNVEDKLKLITELCERENIDLSEVAAIGDDLNDYQLLTNVGSSFCPNDACAEIIKAVKTVLKNNGGSGAVREMIEHICVFDDMKKEFLKHYQG